MPEARQGRRDEAEASEGGGQLSIEHVQRSWLDLCHEVAARHSIGVSEKRADSILWNETSFPMTTDVGFIEEQLDRYFAGIANARKSA